jgi:hypothetical protein
MKRVFALLLGFALIFSAASAFADEDAAWHEMIQVFGQIDGRVAAYDRYDPDHSSFDPVRTSDVYLYAAKLGVEAEPAEFVSGVFSLLYEQFPASPVFGNAKESEFMVDEAYLEFSLFWLYFKLGQFYLPYLPYQPLAISDSTAYLIGEVRQTAYEIGLDSDYFALSFSGFNGKVDLNETPERLDDWLVRLEVRPLSMMENQNLVIGGAFLNDATETTFDFADMFVGQTNGRETLPAEYTENVPSWSAFLNGNFTVSDKLTIDLLYEMVASLPFDEDNYVNAAGDKTNVSALNGELSFVLFKNFWIGGKYDRMFGLDFLLTERYDQSALNEFEPTTYQRYGGFLGVGDKEEISAAIEYLHGSDNEDKTTDQLTLQFLVNF